MISLAFSGVFSNETSSNFRSGLCWRIWGQRLTRNWTGVVNDVPILSTCLGSATIFSARAIESFAYWMRYFESWYKDSPAGVNWTPRCVRTNKSNPRLFSRRLICFMTAFGDTNSSSDALLKLPESATLMNVSN